MNEASEQKIMKCPKISLKAKYKGPKSKAHKKGTLEVST
jgi:hypothetical protein